MVLDFVAGADIGGGGGGGGGQRLRIIDGTYIQLYTTPEGMATAGRRFDVCAEEFFLFFSPFIFPAIIEPVRFDMMCSAFFHK